ncbi:hypothetical protein LCGC14_3148910 [marine sediment metagenome]|uniref:Uncharacterized protein n=1 Tax=marine sediment metagenome TaxID=412755 RepID=A0A0F8Y1J7_9ZZZZ
MKMPYQGKQIEVTEVEAVTHHEPWNEYQLSDGKILKIKTILTKVCRADGEKTLEGEPIYIINTANIVRVK